MIKISSTGNHKKTTSFLNRLTSGDMFSDLNMYGQSGIDALSRSTPVDSKLTANSWKYRIIKSHKRPGIVWYNTNVVDGTPVAILIQYGHATGTGGYVIGRDYINPAMHSIFDNIANDVWEKVKL